MNSPTAVVTPSRSSPTTLLAPFARASAPAGPVSVSLADPVLRQALLVDLDAEAVRLFGRALEGVADIDGCTDFRTARARLFNAPPHLLITNLRLGAYNGLHLVYVAATVAPRTRSVVYADREDPFIIREAREAGAFYESRPRLSYALPAYLCAELPARDRRNPAAFDRRRVFRGGRRAADIAIT